MQAVETTGYIQQDLDRDQYFFAIVHQELRESQATTAGAGYHATNNVDHQAANYVYQKETVDAIYNLATANASD